MFPKLTYLWFETPKNNEKASKSNEKQKKKEK